ncbi:hypothetical protein KGP54_28770, partial [Burkholderia multivorans]|uniref:hypothetical protein n=1 Tax=Burkholderia multivorans TaxID=87883 RepID=UPI0020A00151
PAWRPTVSRVLRYGELFSFIAPTRNGNTERKSPGNYQLNTMRCAIPQYVSAPIDYRFGILCNVGFIFLKMLSKNFRLAACGQMQCAGPPGAPRALADYPDAVISKIERFETSIAIRNRL